jgi:anti-sigma factor RsiW
MMAKIINFGANQHRQTQEALPWYVMGQLDESERMQVDAHLAGCATCRHDLQSERDLATDIVSLPLNADVAWAALRPRLRARARSGVLQRAGRAFERFARRPNRITWLVAGQVLVVVVAATAFSVLPQRPRAEYHALSQQPAYAAGNVIAIFSPDISEARLRETLVANHARIVDGPTAAGAYVLRVPDSERARILVGLQNDEHVILAQQIDAEPSR